MRRQLVFVTALVTLVAGVWITTDRPAKAAFPGLNGKIAFATNRGSAGSREIFVMNADGSDQTNLTNHPAQDVDPAWGTLSSPPPPPSFWVNVAPLPQSLFGGPLRDRYLSAPASLRQLQPLRAGDT